MVSKRTGALALTAALLAGGLLVPAAAATAQEGSAAAYGSCDQLNRAYPHGVSDRRRSKAWWIRRGATAKGAYRPRLYRAVHANLDRDDDHIACER